MAISRSSTRTTLSVRQSNVSVITLTVLGFVALAGSIGYVSATCDQVANLGTPYAYSGCNGQTYTYNGIIENACAYDTTNRTGDGESYNCCVIAQISAGICMKYSDVIANGFPSASYNCYPKSTSGHCPHNHLRCSGATCNGGDDGATACKKDPYSNPNNPIYRCIAP